MSKVSKIHCTDFNALNAVYVRDVGDGVCGFYATLYAEYRYHVGDVEDTLYFNLSAFQRNELGATWSISLLSV